MVSKTSKPDWLPPGWKVQIKVKNNRKIKCYIDSKTCQKFYSKPEVLRHINDESTNDDKSQATEERTKTSSGKQDMHPLVANDPYQWLPIGWTVEIRTRKSGGKKGTVYKCYIDPSSRNAFYSKPEVSRYLKSIEGNEGSSGRQERQSTRHSSDNGSVDQLKEKSELEPNVSQFSKTRARKNLLSGQRQVLVEDTVDEDLPSGWIKEMRKRLQGNKVIRKDPFYFHPASGLVFRSKQEVLRYLETGEISRHAYWRRSGHQNEDKLAVEKNSPPSLVKSEKSTSSRARKEHTDQGDLSLVPEAGVRRITRSYSKFKAASGCESRLVQSSFLSGTVDSRQEVHVLQPPSLVKSEKSTSSRARKEHTGQGDLSLVPEAGVRRITRSSSKFKAATGSDSTLVQSSFLSGTVDYNREVNPSRLLIKMESEGEDATTKVASQSFQNGGGLENNASMMETKPLSASSTDIIMVENTEAVAMQGRSNGKSRNSKRKMKELKQPTVPSRSSKRLAGVDAEVVFHSIPLEHARLASCRKSFRIKPTPTFKSSPDDLPEKPKTPDVHSQSLPVFQEALPQILDVNNSLPVLAVKQISNSDSKMQRVMHVVELDDNPPPGFSNSSSNELQTINSIHFPEEPHDRVRESDMRQIQLPSSCQVQPVALPGDNTELGATYTYQLVQEVQPAKLSMDTEQSASDFNSPSLSPIVNLPKNTSPSFLGARPDALPESKIEPSNSRRSTPEEQQTSMKRKTTSSFLGACPDALPESKTEPSYSGRLAPMEQQASMERKTTTSFLGANPDALPETKSEPSYSGWPAPVEQQASMRKTPSFLGARLPESKIEPSYSGRAALVEQQASMQRDSEQPAASDFSFPSPLWSDPCLEFAYKTLTGAIPLDDNLAIEDYIQHQLRTTKPRNDFQNLPDVDLPNIFQNDETKLVPPLPEGVRFPNGNALGPPKTIW